MDTHRQNEPLTPYLTALIECKARQLVGKAGYTSDDLKDIEQDLIQDLLERLPKFDPAKASLNTFADRVVGRRICNLLRDRRAGMRDWRRDAYSLNEEIETDEGSIERHEFISQDEVDLRTGRYDRTATERALRTMDVAAVLAGLPHELRRVAEMLMTQSVAEVARELGIPRGTFRDRYMGKLREAFGAKRLNDYL
ncbi:MAG TPA: sigma-70 family RNA polymerase sigma factor [Kiritimatiellia bacterium]|nr:sigma-70 family RNA polymerase sigma factor [Kiritimatiellia bacterium]